jgi:polyisoprenoid-binding protein YceI
MRILLVMCCLAAGPVFADGWSLDLTHSELVVKVWKTGAAAGLAHDHVIRASRVTGTASLADAANPRSLSLQLSVEVASLVPDEPETRKRYGVTGPAVPEGDRAKVKENMLGDEQLEATKFPTITFTSKQVSSAADGSLECLGELTLHGVKKEILFPITVKPGEQKIEGDAHVKFKTSDFGVKPYSTALGLIRNQDDVELVVHVALKPN